MRDEDDDLLRAAEELGIDLSGVRAPAAESPAEGEAAAEAADGTDTTSADESLDVEGEDAVEELEVEELLGETAAVGDAAIATDETPEETP